MLNPSEASINVGVGEIFNSFTLTSSQPRWKTTAKKCFRLVFFSSTSTTIGVENPESAKNYRPVILSLVATPIDIQCVMIT